MGRKKVLILIMMLAPVAPAASQPAPLLAWAPQPQKPAPFLPPNKPLKRPV